MQYVPKRRAPNQGALERCAQKRHISGQRGAVMILGLIVLGVVIVAWQHRASLSQTILAQQALDQATVAAAVGVAQLQARTLNAHAMLNRTEMAHQVAMAHLMTMASAWQMRETTGRQARINNPPIWLIGANFFPVAAAMYESTRVGSNPQIISKLRKAFEKHDQMLTGRLRRARAKLNQHFKVRSQALAQEIVRRNLAAGEWAYPQVSVLVQNADGLLKSVRPINDRERRQNWMDNVMEAHAYLKSRWNIRPSFEPFYPNCPWMKHTLTRGGHTLLSVDGNWEANDNMSFHQAKSLVIEALCYYREYPMGWAQVDVNTLKDRSERKSLPFEVLDNLKGTTFRKWAKTLGWGLLSPVNPLSNSWAELKALAKPIRWNRRANLKPWGLNVQGLDPVVTVNTWLQLSAMGRSSLRIRANQPGLLSVNRDAWPKKLKASAAAKVHFDPLDRLVKPQSLKPGLLQPFWTVQQVPVREEGWFGKFQSDFLRSHGNGLTQTRNRLEGPALGSEMRRFPENRVPNRASNPDPKSIRKTQPPIRVNAQTRAPVNARKAPAPTSQKLPARWTKS